MVMDVNKTYCGNHFKNYTDIKYFVVDLKLIQYYMSIVPQ